MELSHKMGFLTGQENDIMLEAHKQSGFTLGEPFATDEAFDFRGSNIKLAAVGTKLSFYAASTHPST
jgi:hypothetical protein